MLAAALAAAGSYADMFGTGTNQFSIDFVNIGNAGNAPDTTGYGAVGYEYRMGKFEVTASQWASVIAADSNVGNAGSRSGSQPTASASWYEAAKFANWLTTGNAYTGAYQFNGSGELMAVDRAAAVSAYGTVYVLPTEDEWYKAAYFKSDGSAYTLYATGDSVPGIETDANYGGYGGAYSTPWDVGTGIAENNGTFDMTGNVWEWNESAYDGTLDNMAEGRVFRGGAYGSSVIYLYSSYRFYDNPVYGNISVGFRVASIAAPVQFSASITNLAGGVEISWNSTSGQTYQVEYTANLTSNTWTTIGGSIQATNSISHMLDANPTHEPRRFYRVISM